MPRSPVPDLAAVHGALADATTLKDVHATTLEAVTVALTAARAAVMANALADARQYHRDRGGVWMRRLSGRPESVPDQTGRP